MLTPEMELMLNQENLSTYQASKLMDFLVSDHSSDSMRAAFLAGMKIKGVKAEELAGFARSLRECSILKRIPGVTDIVGTGGDHKNTINVSTASAITASSVGVRIGKHGNYASTGIHGSADFLKKIGYKFAMTQYSMESIINSKKFAFVLANQYNQHFQKFSAVRKKLGFSSVLNYLGPITNPLDPDIVVIGCTSREAASMYSEVLLGQKKKGCVISAEDGMDEISPMSPTSLFMVDGSVQEITVFPEELKINDIQMNDISSDDPDTIFSLTMNGLSGKSVNVSRFIAANAAPALLLNGRGTSIADCAELAFNAISDGTTSRKLAEIGRES